MKAMKLEKLAGCLIIENGKVLMVKEKKDMYWKIPDGKIEFAETSKECAVRETKEEINATNVDIINFFGKYQFEFKGRTFELYVYRAKIRGTPYITEKHLEAVDWFPIEFLNSKNTIPPNKLIYRDLKK